MKQYVRSFINITTGEIEHIQTSDMPIAGSDIGLGADFEYEDTEIDIPDFNPTRKKPLAFRARELMGKLENHNGQIRPKGNPGFLKIRGSIRNKIK